MVKKDEIKDFPDCPGVYLMRDISGQIIYVGKALSLKKRVANYFSRAHASVKTTVMMTYVRKIEYLRTVDEYQALILESELIKRHQPRFNISLKDDKSYPFIKVSREAFPRVMIGRRKKSEQVERFDWFGPYTSGLLLRKALKVLRKSFPFRSCRVFPKKPCLFFHLRLCGAPCSGEITRGRYARIIGSLEDFLTKPKTALVEDLSLKMRRLVKEEKFEDAGIIRDQLEALSILVSLRSRGRSAASTGGDDWRRLGIHSEPGRIEGFDISNISGQQAVGSMVSFLRGEPDKSQYRRFRIREVSGVDDYAMIREIFRRRYARARAEGARLPDLVLIDGGLGHLKAALSVARELGLRVPIVSLAKKEELVYTVSHRLPCRFEKDSQTLLLLQRVRDEAHRFALKYHHFLRRENVFGKKPSERI